jgi:glucosamine--fructose-6-phosphate aminotransferase (isomerizing)
MCGIIGVTGSKEPLGMLFDGLAALEYRGYDSAGLALIDEESSSIWRVRAAEQAHSLEKLALHTSGAPSVSAAALGHTRWATHGAPKEQNAHPLFDCTKQIALVHNGIIENHRALADALETNGHVFSSETDSEVIAHLLEDEVAAGASLCEALRRTMETLRGDFAIAAISTHEPDVLVAARRTAPLIVGRGEGIGFIASNVAALLEMTRDLYQLGDDEIAEVRLGAVRIIDLHGNSIEPKKITVQWDLDRAQKGGYPDFMSKEIYEQPRAIADTLLGRIEVDATTDIEELTIDKSELARAERVLIVACGSSYHAALVGAQAIESLAQIPAQAEIASEFRYRNAVIRENTLVVAVSQSGETVDTLHAMREAHRLGARVIAVTNVVDSVMTREADGVCYTRAGPEIGVASTKCHVAQLVMLEAFALHLARARQSIDNGTATAFAHELSKLPGFVEKTLASQGQIKDVAQSFAKTRDFYFLGRGVGYPIALEGALKLKELAYVRAEAYAAGEMKHGPISLIEPGAVVVAIATRTALWNKMMSNIAEVRARGATIVALAEVGDDETASVADAVLEVPSTFELCSPIVGVVPLQLFSYEIARLKGNDVDRPRNLAKVVTVE